MIASGRSGRTRSALATVAIGLLTALSVSGCGGTASAREETTEEAAEETYANLSESDARRYVEERRRLNLDRRAMSTASSASRRVRTQTEVRHGAPSSSRTTLAQTSSRADIASTCGRRRRVPRPTASSDRSCVMSSPSAS